MSFTHQLKHHAESVLLLPARYSPFAIQQFVLQRLTQLAFQPLIDSGELDCLRQRRLGIRVRDLKLRWYFSLSTNGRIEVRRHGPPDAMIEGGWRDFLAMAAQREDPDTLFFQRRLRITGDTDFSHEIKNVMDAAEFQGAAARLQRLLVALDRLANKAD